MRVSIPERDPARRSRALSIADLVAATDVPPATIHYYLRQQLLPPPRRLAANRFAYDERHVQRLRLIRTLREQRGLSLDMIRRILPELLRLEGEEAFRPEMWDRALAPRMSRRRLPSQRLLDAAKDAFGKRGYGDVNVDDICRAAGIAKGSFYRHYRSKEDLFFAAVDSTAADLTRAFAGAVGGAPVTQSEAGAILAPLLEPRLPIFLDLFARSLQRHAGYPATFRTVFGSVASGLGELVVADGTPIERGARAFGAALIEVFRRTLTGAAAPPDPVTGAQDLHGVL